MIDLENLEKDDLKLLYKISNIIENKDFKRLIEILTSECSYKINRDICIHDCDCYNCVYEQLLNFDLVGEKIECIDDSINGLSKNKIYTISNVLVRDNEVFYEITDDYDISNIFRKSRFIYKKED